MIDFADWSLEMMYAAKTIYDAGLWERFSQMLAHDYEIVVGGDFTFDPEFGPILYGIAISSVFETTKGYYNQEEEREITVFWDPLMYRYNKLCREYEARRGIVEIENPYVEEAVQAVHKAMNFSSYSYDYRYYTGTKSPKDSKLVFIEDPEFCNAWEVPAGLVELRQFYIEGVARLEAELAPKDSRKKRKGGKAKVIALPAPGQKWRKEAA